MPTKKSRSKKRGPGRPKGSKNKRKSPRRASRSRRGPGRPRKVGRPRSKSPKRRVGRPKSKSPKRRVGRPRKMSRSRPGPGKPGHCNVRSKKACNRMYKYCSWFDEPGKRGRCGVKPPAPPRLPPPPPVGYLGGVRKPSPVRPSRFQDVKLKPEIPQMGLVARNYYDLD